MHYLVVQASPKPENEQATKERISGAYVRCWVDFAIEDGARLLAAHYIDEAGWNPEVINEITTVGAHDYTDTPGSQQFVDEARERGVALVFLPWQADD